MNTARLGSRIIAPLAAFGVFAGLSLPAHAYVATSDIAVITDTAIVDADSELKYELGQCTTCWSELSKEGTDVVVPPAMTVEAAPVSACTKVVTAPIESATTSTITTLAPTSYCNSQIARTYHYENGFGNSNFGAGYVVDASVNATPTTLGPSFDARGEGRVYGRIFGTQRDAVQVTANGTSPAGGAASGSANVYILGSQVFARSFTASYSTGATFGPRRFFSVSYTFTVGPVPVTVSASADGSIGFTGTGTLSASTLVVNVTPTGSLTAVASASVNVIIVSFGVSGSLTLINAALPANLTVSPCATTRWSISLNRDIYTLSGQIDLWVKVKLLFINKKWTVTIARWTGSHSVGTIYSASGV